MPGTMHGNVAACSAHSCISFMILLSKFEWNEKRTIEWTWMHKRQTNQRAHTIARRILLYYANERRVYPRSHNTFRNCCLHKKKICYCIYMPLMCCDEGNGLSRDMQIFLSPSVVCWFLLNDTVQRQGNIICNSFIFFKWEIKQTSNTCYEILIGVWIDCKFHYYFVILEVDNWNQ